MDCVNLLSSIICGTFLLREGGKMKIQILGPGCSKCNRLKELASAAVKELGIIADVEKISDISQIMSLGVMSTPGLVVNGEVKCVGRVPSLEEMKNLLQ